VFSVEQFAIIRPLILLVATALGAAYVSYEEEDTCHNEEPVSYEEEDTCHNEEEDTCHSVATALGTAHYCV
jgi:hypothetical protein